MDIVTYALAKKLISSALTGIADAKVIDNDLIISTNDGQNFKISFPTPSDYKVKNVDIDNDTLIIDKSNSKRTRIKNILVLFFYIFFHSFCEFNIYTLLVSITKQLLPAAQFTVGNVSTSASVSQTNSITYASTSPL